MPKNYQLYPHAGTINYAQWKEDGIDAVIFDKDGTLTDANKIDLVEEVMEGLEEQDFRTVYPEVAIASNNHDAGHVQEFAESLNRRLGVKVFAVCRAQGFQSKPHPEMGLVIADHFGVTPEQVGVVGDRRLTDVQFSRAMGAGATALCDKAGTGDAKWVPMLRKLESGIVAVERMTGIAVPGRDY